MAVIPKNVTELADRIYAHYEKVSNDEPARLTRIGASGIGGECNREIWLDWRGAYSSQFAGRMLRLFQTGHIQEERVLADLANAGLEVWAFDDEGNQWTYTSGRGHFVAKLDGVVRGVPGAEKTPHTLEIKSSNQKGFDEVVKKGVKVAKPYHYAQMQSGMHISKISRALYVMINKNDESFYVERVEYDPQEAEKLERKINSLVDINSPPPKIAENPDSYPCKFCDAKSVCWGAQPPIKNCRTCVVAIPADDGAWICGMTNSPLTQKEQLVGCEHWRSVL